MSCIEGVRIAITSLLSKDDPMKQKSRRILVIVQYKMYGIDHKRLGENMISLRERKDGNSVP